MWVQRDYRAIAVVILEIASVEQVAHLTDEGMVTGFLILGNKFLHQV